MTIHELKNNVEQIYIFCALNPILTSYPGHHNWFLPVAKPPILCSCLLSNHPLSFSIILFNPFSVSLPLSIFLTISWTETIFFFLSLNSYILFSSYPLLPISFSFLSIWFFLPHSISVTPFSLLWSQPVYLAPSPLFSSSFYPKWVL